MGGEQHFLQWSEGVANFFFQVAKRVAKYTIVHAKRNLTPGGGQFFPGLKGGGAV